jgi:DNA (cytosine-5)-methyltransferase 1
MPKGADGNFGPTLVSLFTGAGGLDIGLELAGFRTVAAVDSDADCVATMRLNQERSRIGSASRLLTETRILHASVEDLAPRDLRPKGANADWSLDLLAGGPPCQPFSSAGHMLSLKDPRGRLFEHFVRLAKGLKPRVILFENVRGLVTALGPHGRPGEAVALVRSAFESIGYATTFGLLNAADFGAPQRRVRLFMMATRNTRLPSFPAPTHSDRPDTLFGQLSPWITLGDFLQTMPAADDADIDLPSPTLSELLKEIPAGSGLKSAGLREATRPGGHWGYKQGTFIGDPSKPARTVTAAATQDWVRDAGGRLRRLTWRECALLQGFPAGWEFVGNKASRFRQIGNAVPAVFGQVLGAALLRVLREEWRVKRPESAPFPSEFVEAIEYTKRERRRNGPSRTAVKAALAEGRATAAEAKGLGSAELEQETSIPRL